MKLQTLDGILKIEYSFYESISSLWTVLCAILQEESKNKYNRGSVSERKP